MSILMDNSIFKFILFFFGFGSVAISANSDLPEEEKRVLYIASYHVEHGDWSAGIKSGIETVLASRNNISLKVVNMDTKRNKAENFKKEVALKMKGIIEVWKPDIVITSDDNASKYLIQRYFSDSDLPFVFCGVNWDASKYGFPTKNVTGMIEVQLIEQLIGYLSSYAKGSKVGALRGDTMSNRNEARHFEEHLGISINTRFVDDIKQWKEQFISLQSEVDIVLLGDMIPVEGYQKSNSDMELFILENTKIPTGHWDAWLKDEALMTLATIPQEQGVHAANVALDILDGTPVKDIPIVKNKKAQIFLNMNIAKKMKIRFPIELIERAHLVGVK